MYVFDSSKATKYMFVEGNTLTVSLKNNSIASNSTLKCASLCAMPGFLQFPFRTKATLAIFIFCADGAPFKNGETVLFKILLQSLHACNSRSIKDMLMQF